MNKFLRIYKNKITNRSANTETMHPWLTEATLKKQCCGNIQPKARNKGSGSSRIRDILLHTHHDFVGKIR